MSILNSDKVLHDVNLSWRGFFVKKKLIVSSKQDIQENAQKVPNLKNKYI